jgi:hypothetical protein
VSELLKAVLTDKTARQGSARKAAAAARAVVDLQPWMGFTEK